MWVGHLDIQVESRICLTVCLLWSIAYEEKVVKLCLEARTRSEGCMARAFEARCPKPSLVGSHRFSVRYMGG